MNHQTWLPTAHHSPLSSGPCLVPLFEPASIDWPHHLGMVEVIPFQSAQADRVTTLLLRTHNHHTTALPIWILYTHARSDRARTCTLISTVRCYQGPWIHVAFNWRSLHCRDPSWFFFFFGKVPHCTHDHGISYVSFEPFSFFLDGQL